MPSAVVAVVLAAAVLAGVLLWQASPAAPGSLRTAAPGSLGPAAPGSLKPAGAGPRKPAGAGPLKPDAPRPPGGARALQPNAVIHMARARQQRRHQRTAQAIADGITAAGGGAAVGVHSRPPGTSHPPAGSPGILGPGPAPAAVASWTAVSGSEYTTNSSACTAELWTSQVSAGDPAYIAADAVQMAAPYTCQVMVQTSTDGGQTWTSGRPVSLPAAAYPFTFAANTSAVYDGPGYLGRACAQGSNAALSCTAAISLAAGAGTPPDPAVPAGTIVTGASAGNGSVMCDAHLYATTSVKGPGTLVDGEFRAGSMFSTTAALCEGWLETSADGGKTWQETPPVAFQAPVKSVTFDFTATTADGTGLRARACVEAPTISATPWCSPTW